MRKMKKINGYLVVKFNARELREYEGTALGEYGVIDAELYTGILDVDRGAMEYDNAGSMEEAVELARGLESELDAEGPEVKVTIVKETDETTEEEEVDAQQMIAGWENVLRGQVASAHYKDVDERTAAHELYGYKVALRDLGLLDREDCYVLPDTFGDAPGPLPKKPEELLSYVCDELCRHRRPEMTQEELDAVCEKCSLERLANEADGRDLRAREKAFGALYGLIDRIRDRESRAEADRVGAEARAYTVTDVEGDNVVVTEFIDDKKIRSYQATLGQEETIELSRENWLTLTNGAHQLRVEAVDGNFATSVRVWNFSKKETVIAFQFAKPEETDARATKILITPTWHIEGSVAKVEACNNAFDDSPAWEDITAQVAINRVYNFLNESKTAEKWGVNVRFTITKNEGYEEEVSISGFGGAYE